MPLKIHHVSQRFFFSHALCLSFAVRFCVYSRSKINERTTRIAQQNQPTHPLVHSPTWLWLVCLPGQVRVFAAWDEVSVFRSLNRWHLGRASIWRSQNVCLGCNWAMPESPQSDRYGEKESRGVIGRESEEGPPSELLMLISCRC